MQWNKTINLGSINFVLFLISYGTLWRETVSYKILCSFIIYHIALIQMMLSNSVMGMKIRTLLKNNLNLWEAHI